MIKIQFFKLESVVTRPDGAVAVIDKLIAGEVINQTSDFLTIRGCYLELVTEETIELADGTAEKKFLDTKPFSPVGGKIQEMTYPMSKISGELVDVEPYYRRLILALYQSETQRAAMQASYLNMVIPPRVAESPEEALAAINAYIQANGELPRTPGDTAQFEPFFPGVSAAVFQVQETSPYRPENQGTPSGESE